MVQFITWTYKHIKLCSPNSANSVVCVLLYFFAHILWAHVKDRNAFFFSPLRIWTFLKHILQRRLIQTAPWPLSSRPAKLQDRATQNVKESLTLCYKSQVFQYAKIYANRNQGKRTFS